ncbi:hypothetical protein CS022_09835 [Veronia nyctiphanis]|uniref:Uncharacterized protein n=1 Tax=Veronia nyctiphanis TaxID=1278244 RepID=A0A4Q0YQB1_9GAMM|nr:hypothetical protein [Veronia nyctiphanis]RXJ73290.1 hypothetical protein CS022_09835 [Veronia nyctiphanis]
MDKRRFFRLDEISDVAPVTKGDLLNAVDSGRLSLCAWVDARALGTQLRSDEPNRPALANLFDYSGVVGISSKQSIECVNTLKTSVTRALVLQPVVVNSFRTVN